MARRAGVLKKHACINRISAEWPKAGQIDENQHFHSGTVNQAWSNEFVDWVFSNSIVKCNPKNGGAKKSSLHKPYHCRRKEKRKNQRKTNISTHRRGSGSLACFLPEIKWCYFALFHYFDRGEHNKCIGKVVRPLWLISQVLYPPILDHSSELFEIQQTPSLIPPLYKENVNNSCATHFPYYIHH